LKIDLELCFLYGQE
jgi:hypothetical protein